MKCISISESKYVKDYQIFLKFNNGETGEVDLRDLVFKYSIAEPLRNTEAFSQFYLDSWPTLALNFGFDVDPESVYFRAMGISAQEKKNY